MPQTGHQVLLCPQREAGAERGWRGQPQAQEEALTAPCSPMVLSAPPLFSFPPDLPGTIFFSVSFISFPSKAPSPNVTALWGLDKAEELLRSLSHAVHFLVVQGLRTSGKALKCWHDQVRFGPFSPGSLYPVTIVLQLKKHLPSVAPALFSSPPPQTSTAHTAPGLQASKINTQDSTRQLRWHHQTTQCGSP